MSERLTDMYARVEAERNGLLARVRELEAALRAEVRKRHYYTDGSHPDDAWIDAKIAEMYPALAAVPDPQEQTNG